MVCSGNVLVARRMVKHWLQLPDFLIFTDIYTCISEYFTIYAYKYLMKSGRY